MTRTLATVFSFSPVDMVQALAKRILERRLRVASALPKSNGGLEPSTGLFVLFLWTMEQRRPVNSSVLSATPSTNAQACTLLLLQKNQKGCSTQEREVPGQKTERRNKHLRCRNISQFNLTAAKLTWTLSPRFESQKFGSCVAKSEVHSKPSQRDCQRNIPGTRLAKRADSKEIALLRIC